MKNVTDTLPVTELALEAMAESSISCSRVIYANLGVLTINALLTTGLMFFVLYHVQGAKSRRQKLAEATWNCVNENTHPPRKGSMMQAISNLMVRQLKGNHQTSTNDIIRNTSMVGAGMGYWC